MTRPIGHHQMKPRIIRTTAMMSPRYASLIP
jgi:hypothetical protein